MNYELFANELVKGLENELGSGYRLRVDHLLYNNDMAVDALTILRDGENISPAIHLDMYYREYCHGTSVEDLCRRIATGYQRSGLGGSMDARFLQDWDAVRGRVVGRLVGRRRNRRRLNEVVYTPFLDMAVIYYYVFPTEDGVRASIAVKRSMAKEWGVGPEEIDAVAAVNTREINPHCFMGMDRMMDEMLHSNEPQVSSPLYVLTNQERLNGAYWIRDREVMDDIAGQIGDGFLVLPSSIHECMILPPVKHMNIEELKDMVREINRTEVDPEEVLTDNVYRYFRERGLTEAVT